MPKKQRPMPKEFPPKETLDRFWAKVNKKSQSPCWIWTAANVNGYGAFGYLGVNWRAHRFSYWLVNGAEKLDKNESMHHTCENPPCVNPRHVIPMSNAQNTKFYGASITHCKRGHEFTAESTGNTSNGRRYCLICARARDRKRYKAKYEKEKAKKHEYYIKMRDQLKDMTSFTNSSEPKAKLTEEQRKEIVRRYYQEQNSSYRSLAREYNVSYAAIGYLIKTRT